MKCKLCGAEFSESAITCKGCPLFGKCKVIIRCPNCGYQTVEEGTVANLIKKIFLKRKKETKGEKENG